MTVKNGGPYAIGGALWPGLSKLIEETGEIQQVAGKLLGAGGEVLHWDGSNLHERLQDELADVLAACRFVIEVNELDSQMISSRFVKKLKQFHEWHKENIQ